MGLADRQYMHSQSCRCRLCRPELYYQYECEKCGAAFATLSGLRAHKAAYPLKHGFWRSLNKWLFLPEGHRWEE